MRVNFITLIQISLLSLFGCDHNDAVNVNEPDYQIFTINTKGDTLLIGKKGTKILIPKNSFIKKDSVLANEIEFSIEEYYDISDILLRGLTTLSSGRVLETGGMVYIKATSEGDPVYLSSDSYLDIYFKKADSTKLFIPFRGVSSGMNSEIEWIVNDSIELEGPTDIQIIKLGLFSDSLVVNINPAESFFRSRVMGWINADIFLDYHGNETLWVKTPPNSNSRPQLVFREINSILPGEKIDDDLYKFNVPDSLKWILFFKENKNNKIYYDLIRKEDEVGDTVVVRPKLGSMQLIKDRIDLMVESSNKD